MSFFENPFFAKNFLECSIFVYFGKISPFFVLLYLICWLIIFSVIAFMGAIVFRVTRCMTVLREKAPRKTESTQLAPNYDRKFVFEFYILFYFLWNNFDFWPKFQFLTKFSIFAQNFDFLIYLRFFTKISIFDQNFDFWSKFRFFGPNFDFYTKFRFLYKISIFCTQFRFLYKISISLHNYYFFK